MPYTDFFEFLAPGSFYLVAAAWSVFGSTYWAAKAIAIAGLLAAAYGIDRISRLVLERREGGESVAVLVAGPLLFCVLSGYLPAINHNTFHLPLAVWTTWLLIMGLQRPRWAWYAAAGVLCGVGIWFLQHRAAVMLATMVAVLAFLGMRERRACRWRHLLVFMAGTIIAASMLVLFWAPAVLIENLLVFPATRYLEVNRVEGWLLLSAATALVTAAWLLRKRLTVAVCLLLMLQASLLMTALQRPDLSHVTSTLFPLLCLLPLLIGMRAETTASRVLRGSVAGWLLVLPVPLALGIAANPWLYFSDWSRHPALQYVREHCGPSTSLYAGPFSPGLYFETGKSNPTRYSFLLPGLTTPEQYLDALEAIRAHPPECAILNYRMVEKFGYTRDNVIDRYLASSYDIVYKAGSQEVWKARGSAGAGASAAAGPDN